MERLIPLFLGVSVLTSAWAAGPAERLAIDSYQHLVLHESLLDGAIRSGDPRDFERFILKPTQDLLQRWPQMGDPAFDKFARCRFALDGFRLYAEDQFKVRGSLPKDRGQAADYFSQKRQCEKALKGSV